jgi:hypothetical protein
LTTRLGRAGIIPFLIAALIQVCSPMLGSSHLACVDHACETGPLAAAPAHEPTQRDSEQSTEPADHDPLACQICRTVMSARSLLVITPDFDWSLSAPQNLLLQRPTLLRLGWEIATSSPVRAPPSDPSLRYV